jgi:hypothetical protein
MHFDSFSLGVRHLFQKLVLFFLCVVILVIHCCFQNKNLSQNYLLQKNIYLPFEKKKYFDSLTLKPLELYVNLVGRFVAYSQSGLSTFGSARRRSAAGPVTEWRSGAPSKYRPPRLDGDPVGRLFFFGDTCIKTIKTRQYCKFTDGCRI